jgi:hypothetical protein
MCELMKHSLDTPPIITDNETDKLENSMSCFVLKAEER